MCRYYVSLSHLVIYGVYVCVCVYAYFWPQMQYTLEFVQSSDSSSTLLLSGEAL